MIPDIVNGSLEFTGSIAMWYNAYQTYKDKGYSGVSAISAAFIVFWGFWNLYYYPHLDQWFSFTGGISIVAANICWLFLMVYYGRKTQ